MAVLSYHISLVDSLHLFCYVVISFSWKARVLSLHKSDQRLRFLTISLAVEWPITAYNQSMFPCFFYVTLQFLWQLESVRYCRLLAFCYLVWLKNVAQLVHSQGILICDKMFVFLETGNVNELHSSCVGE